MGPNAQAGVGEAVQRALHVQKAAQQAQQPEILLSASIKQHQDITQPQHAQQHQEAQHAQQTQQAQQAQQAGQFEEAGQPEHAHQAQQAIQARQVREAQQAQHAQQSRDFEQTYQAQHAGQAQEAQHAAPSQQAQHAQQAEHTQHNGYAQHPQQPQQGHPCADLSTSVSSHGNQPQTAMRKSSDSERSNSQSFVIPSSSLLREPGPDTPSSSLVGEPAPHTALRNLPGDSLPRSTQYSQDSASTAEHLSGPDAISQKPKAARPQLWQVTTPHGCCFSLGKVFDFSLTMFFFARQAP